MANEMIGTTMTVTFGTSSYAASITGVTNDNRTVPVLDTTHMGTTNSRTKTVGDLVDEGTLTLTVFYDQDDPAPVNSTSETVTQTFRTPAAKTAGATKAGTAAVTSESINVPLEDMMTATVVVTWLDEVTDTVSAA